MKILISLAALLASASCTTTSKLIPRQSSIGSLPVVSVQGNAFWANGERFYIRGVAYQPGGAADAKDPLVDIPALRRDIANFRDLGINTIRVYTIDNSKPHKEAMRMLDEAGIYLALDANTPDFSLNRDDVHQSYNEKYLQSVFATVDNFASYSNTLLFFAGNEVINAKNNTNTAPYIKAVVRDMKTYIANRGYRAIPVGYAAADVSENIEEQLAYIDCGADISRGDFFAVNDYSWCSPSSFEQSGWDQKVQKYRDYGSPLFLAEFGCIANTRKWDEISSLYNPNEMTPVFSGGLAYEYTLEENGYGLVHVDPSGTLEPNADFRRLKEAFASTSNPSGSGGARLSTEASQCPSQSQLWEVRNETIPAPPAGIETFMEKGAGKGPGLGDDVTSSQFGGKTYSESWIQMDASEPSRTPSSGGSGADGDSAGGENAASGVKAGSLVACTAALVLSAAFGGLLL